MVETGGGKIPPFLEVKFRVSEQYQCSVVLRDTE